MAINKKEAFEAGEIELAEIAKALSHPARLQIIRVLAEKNVCICGEIVDVLPLSQSTVSQHLKELKRVGIIKGTIDGVRSCYCLNWENIERFFQLFTRFFDDLKSLKNDSTCC